MSFVIECRNPKILRTLGCELSYFMGINSGTSFFCGDINLAAMFETLYDARKLAYLHSDEHSLCVVDLDDEKNGLFKPGVHYVIQSGELSRVVSKTE